MCAAHAHAHEFDAQQAAVPQREGRRRRAHARGVVCEGRVRGGVVHARDGARGVRGARVKVRGQRSGVPVQDCGACEVVAAVVLERRRVPVGELVRIARREERAELGVQRRGGVQRGAAVHDVHVPAEGHGRGRDDDVRRAEHVHVRMCHLR